MELPKLNLPPINLRTKLNENGERLIWDQIRKKYILLTPEEWVRQHFISLLISNLNYPSGLFRVEKQHSYNQLKKRCDIEVLDRDFNQTFLLVECKAHDVTLGEETLRQVTQYNLTIKAKYVAITNGMKHFIWKYQHHDNSYVNQDSFPIFADLD